MIPQTLARALGGDVSGQDVLVPGPGHSRKDRSLSIRLDNAAPEGFLVHSFAGDDPKVCLSHVRGLLGLDQRARIERPRQAPRQRNDDEARTGRALAIWAEAGAPGPLAQTYATRRGLTLPETDALRFHPNCPFGRDRLPCIVGLMTDPRTGEATGIHRTALRPDGTKIDRKMLGRSGVVRLCGDADVTSGIGIAEGIETALAVAQAGWEPVWAALSAGGISRFPVLAGIEALTVFADADNAGMEAARHCAQRWADAGREARIVAAPEAGTDWADHLAEADHAPAP